MKDKSNWIQALKEIDLISHGNLREQVNALRRLQAESQVELDALLPSVLDGR